MKSLTIDAHAWMQRLRFEYYHVAALRQLRIGERLWIGYTKGAGITEDVDGLCEAQGTGGCRVADCPDLRYRQW